MKYREEEAEQDIQEEIPKLVPYFSEEVSAHGMKRLNEDRPNGMKIEYFNRDFNRTPAGPFLSPD